MTREPLCEANAYSEAKWAFGEITRLKAEMDGYVRAQTQIVEDQEALQAENERQRQTIMELKCDGSTEHVAQLQAENERLREALKTCRNCLRSNGFDFWVNIANTALAQKEPTQERQAGDVYKP